MANVLHKNLTGTDLHEPKGVASATINQVYVADGAGSGAWFVLRPVGEIIDYIGTTEPTGFLFCDGDTIGNASSNGTARANADTVDLFSVLWSIGDTYGTLAIFDSAGAASTFGVDAPTDFAANKAIALPDLRERVVAGWDNKGNVSRLTSATVDGDDVGAVGGGETVTLVQGNLPDVNFAHTLTITDHIHSSGTYGTNQQGANATGNLNQVRVGTTELANGVFSFDGSPATQIDAGGSSGTIRNIDFALNWQHSHTVTGQSGNPTTNPAVDGTVPSGGSDTPVEITQPTFICTKLIFYGA